MTVFLKQLFALTLQVLDAVALQLCLSQLEPRADEFADPQTRLVWCNRVLAIRSSAENMLYNKSQYGPKTTRILHDCRSVTHKLFKSLQVI